MTTPYILALKDSRANLATVGGKGASLARLAQAGLSVPNGFHITTAAYQRFIVENELLSPIFTALQSVDTAQPVTVESAAGEIHMLFAHAVMPPSIADDIRSAYNTLCHQSSANGPLPVAVRSSATAEDLPDLAFAGQHETYLNIRGEEAVLDAVKKCWASLWTARAISYRAQNQIEPQTISLAVTVQQLIPAEATGILFTANPISGQRNQGLLTATWGLGEAIVGGLVTPDTLLIDKSTGRIVKRETADKQIMTVRVESGTQEQATPEQLRRAPVLTDVQAAELMRNGVQIEELYGMPMDIEWTLAEGKLAILQARPITALPEPPLEWPLPDSKAVLARGSLAEFVPEPVSPLFATLAVPIARETTTQLMQEMGVTEKDAYLFTVINHYVYIGIKFTPSLVWQFTIATFRLTKMLLTTAAARATQQREKCLAVKQKWQARDLTTLTPTEILIGVREIFRATAEYYNVAQSGTIPTSMMSELTFAAFYDRLIKRKADPESATFIFGSDNQAVRAEKALFDLALWVQEHPDLANAVRQASTQDVCLALSAPHTDSHWVEFCTRFAAHLAQYGHAIYDLDFSKPVPAEKPTPIVEMFKLFLKGGNNPYERQQTALDRRDRAANAIAQRLDPLRRKCFWQLLKWAQGTAHLREDSIADLGLGYPQLRKMLSELGHRLANNGAIAQTQDVYWLEAKEVDASALALERGEPLKNYSRTVTMRQAKWQAMRHISPPTTLPRKTWMAAFYPNEGRKDNLIKGFGASAGKVTAPACVILGPEDFGKLRPGDVIVTGITTPAWTPLFARAAAIVTDIGGLLSHSSIVAREYGIPAVLATGNGTRRICDGQVITVDGGAGTVTLSSSHSRANS